MEQVKRELHQQAVQVEEQANSVEEDLKVEREWRISLQETMQQDRERISKLQHENSQLKIVADVSKPNISSYLLCSYYFIVYRNMRVFKRNTTL